MHDDPPDPDDLVLEVPGADLDLVRVLVEVEPYHLDRPFDYVVTDAPPELDVGWRVEVLFSGRVRRALVVGRPTSTDVAPDKLRPIRRVLGDYPWATDDDIELFTWAARRWGGTRADVIRHALPARRVRVEQSLADQGLLPWSPQPMPDPATDVVANASDNDDAATIPDGWARYVNGGPDFFSGLGAAATPRMWRPTPDEDVAARLAEAVVATVTRGRDALVVVPDAGSRIAADLSTRLQSALVATGALQRDQVVDVTGLSSASAITRAWLRARTGRARVVIGERRVALWPLARPGLHVVVDEANPALKERRSPRHHVREVLLERGRRHDAATLLVGHVPSAPAWALMRAGRLGTITATRATEVAAAPEVIVDGHHQRRLGDTGIRALRDAVAADSYGVVLAARRGEGRAMVCRTCGDMPACPTCGAALAGHGNGLGCLRCGWRTRHRRCRECNGTDFVPLAAGTQRLAHELRQTISSPVVELEGYDAAVPAAPAVLVMTRGSVMDRPPGPVGAVVAGDVDAMARRPSVDAAEDTLRLLFTLGTWVAASPRATLVVVTRDPEGAVPTALRRWDPGGFWRATAAQRSPFPPVRDAIAIIAPDEASAAEVTAAVGSVDVQVLGPVPVDGGHRLLCLTTDRAATVDALAHVRRDLSHRNVALHVDVDPVDLT